MSSDTGTLDHEDDLIATDEQHSKSNVLDPIVAVAIVVVALVIVSVTVNWTIAQRSLENTRGIGATLAIVQNEKDARPVLDTTIVDVTTALDALRDQNGRYPLTLGPDPRQPTLDVSLPDGVAVGGYIVSADGQNFTVSVSRGIVPKGVIYAGRTVSTVTYDSTTGQTTRTPGYPLNGD